MEELSELVKKGGFRLNKWICNESKVLDGLPPEEVAGLISIIPLGAISPLPSSTKEPETHVLGLKWECGRDILVVSRGTKCDEKPRNQKV